MSRFPGRDRDGRGRGRDGPGRGRDGRDRSRDRRRRGGRGPSLPARRGGRFLRRVLSPIGIAPGAGYYWDPWYGWAVDPYYRGGPYYRGAPYGAGLGLALPLAALGGFALGGVLSSRGRGHMHSGADGRGLYEEEEEEDLYDFVVPEYDDGDEYYEDFDGDGVEEAEEAVELVDDDPDDKICEELMQDLSTVGDGRIAIRQSKIPGAGLGVFAEQAIRRSEPITLYYGQVIDFKEAVRRKRANQDTHIVTLLPRAFAIDARFDENGNAITDPAKQLEGMGAGGFINDSDRTPNAELVLFDCKENRDLLRQGAPEEELEPAARILFVRATRRIRAGEEITVAYSAGQRKRMRALLQRRVAN